MQCTSFLELQDITSHQDLFTEVLQKRCLFKLINIKNKKITKSSKLMIQIMKRIKLKKLYKILINQQNLIPKRVN